MVLNRPAILNFIRYFSAFAHLLPLVFFIIFKKGNNEKSLKVIFYYILYCLFDVVFGYFLYSIHFENTFFIFAFFTVAEFTFFCLFLYYVLTSRKAKKIILPIWVIFLILAFVDFFFINKMNSFDSLTVGVESILIILMCIFYLAVQIKGSNNLFVYSTSNFWVIISFLIYISGTFFLYVMAENMIQNRAFLIEYNIINSIFIILKNILLSIAMLMKSTPASIQLQKNKDYDDLLSYKLKT